MNGGGVGVGTDADIGVGVGVVLGGVGVGWRVGVGVDGGCEEEFDVSKLPENNPSVLKSIDCICCLKIVSKSSFIS